MAEEQPSALIPLDEKQVAFYEDEITAVLIEAGGRQEVYVPIKPICDQLGLSWPGQFERIQRDPVLGEEVKSVAVTSAGGRQEMTCLPLSFLNGWLFGVQAGRVREGIREKLLRYQRECYRVLHEAFQSGRLSIDPTYDDILTSESEAAVAYRMALAITRLARNQFALEERVDKHEERLTTQEQRLDQVEALLGQEPEHVTDAQASQLSQAVKAVAMALSKRTGRNEYGGVYGELYRRYEISSYKLLPRRKFQHAMDWLAEWYQNLTGESIF